MSVIKNENDEMIKNAFKKKGLTGVASMLKDRLNNWEDEKVNVAVIGRSGVGKSSFINAIRNNLNEDHPLYAKVGVTECTVKRQPYPHPENEHLIFWDVPGVGTESFPRKKYIKHEEVLLRSYDAFILMTKDRFTEDEIWLGTEIEKMGKTFLFVRSQVDSDIDNEKKEKAKAGKVSNPKQTVDKIRENCITHVKKHFTKDIKDVYLISSFQLTNCDLDFDKLVERLVLGFSDVKREVMLKSLGFLTKSLLKEKIKSLKKRIWGMGFLSSITGAVPIPWTSLVADGLLIANETRLYRKYLGLSDKDLESLAKLMGISVDTLAEKYSLKSLSLTLWLKGAAVTTALVASEVVESVVGLALPVIGMPVGAVVSFATTVNLLQTILKILEEDAEIVIELLLTHTKSRVHKLS